MLKIHPINLLKYILLLINIIKTVKINNDNSINFFENLL